MFEPIEIAVKRLDHAGDLPLPCYETSGSAGMDVRAAEALNIAPGNRGLAGTGFAFAIPEGYEIQVRPRSGLALKNGAETSRDMIRLSYNRKKKYIRYGFTSDEESMFG